MNDENYNIWLDGNEGVDVPTDIPYETPIMTLDEMWTTSGEYWIPL